MLKFFRSSRQCRSIRNRRLGFQSRQARTTGNSLDYKRNTEWLAREDINYHWVTDCASLLTHAWPLCQRCLSTKWSYTIPHPASPIATTYQRRTRMSASVFVCLNQCWPQRFSQDTVCRIYDTQRPSKHSYLAPILFILYYFLSLDNSSCSNTHTFVCFWRCFPWFWILHLNPV